MLLSVSSFLRALFVLVLCLFSTQLLASPYDDYLTRPGTRITNVATLTYNKNTLTMPPLTTSAQLVVQNFPLTGRIVAYERHRANGSRVSFPIQTGFWADSSAPGRPSRPMPEIVDISNLTGGDIYDLPSTLDLVQTRRVRQGVPLFFAVFENALNIDANAIDTIVVDISADTTGDVETILFYETGPNTGVFAGWINTTGRGPITRDGALRTTPEAIVTASYANQFNASQSLSVDVLVVAEPTRGRVFDSSTGRLLNNIPFTVVNAQTGQPALLQSEDLQATYPSALRTGATLVDSLGRNVRVPEGTFLLPYLAPGSYRLVLGDASTHTGPSTRAANELPGGPWTIEDASYLMPFTVTDTQTPRFDIPLDPLQGRPDVVRNGSLREGAIGDILEYRVELTPPPTPVFTFRDTLPAGVSPIEGTYRINGQSWTPIVQPNGRDLLFVDVPNDSEPGQPVVLTYGARIVAETSLVTVTTLLVNGQDGPSDDHDIELSDAFDLQSIAILGQITAGPCGEPAQNRVLSNIRVLLETGDYVLTDANGQFSFRDIERKARVVQLDTNSLPTGATAVLCQSNTRAAGSAISRFVDSAPGHFARVDFQIVFDDEVVARVDAERAAIEAPAPAQTPFDVYTEEWFKAHTPTQPSLLAPSARFAPTSESLEIVFVRHKNERAALAVNGKDTRPSVQYETVENGNFVLERWSGVRVPEGQSALTFTFSDALTGAALRTEVHPIAFSTRPGQLTLDAEGGVLRPDGQGLTALRVRVTNHQGIPVRAGTKVQFSIAQPYAFLSRPARDSVGGEGRRPTQQIDAEIGQDGLVFLELAPVRAPGRAVISVNTDTGPVSLNVPVRLDAQPWVFVGLAEGTLAHSTVRDNMRPLSSNANPYAGRVAFFAEGVISGKWLLTLRYDSDSSRESNSIDPDKDYIVYGDRSVQGQAAKGRFPLFVRLQSEDASLLLGDFNLDVATSLITENREVSGLQAIYTTDTWRVMAFAGETEQATARDRIALNGSIGPYVLTQPDVAPHSETLRVSTVSRLDATREISSIGLVAGQDYVIDYATGRIWLRRPLPAFTPSLDRNILVVDYETDSGALPTRIAGVRVDGTITPRVQIGGTVMRAERVAGGATVSLLGIDATYKISDNTTFKAETIVVKKDFVDGSITNTATQVELTHLSDNREISARYRRQKGDVELTSERSQDEIETASLGVSWKIGKDGDTPTHGRFVNALATWDRNLTTGEERSAIDLVRLTTNARGSWGGGLSWSDQRDTDGARTRDIAAIGLAEWASQDLRMRQSLQTRSVLWSEGKNAVHSATLQATYEIADPVSVFVRLDGEQNVETDDTTHAATFGVTLTPWSNTESLLALTRAGASAAQQWSVYSALTQTIPLGEHSELTFGGDAQTRLSQNDLPIQSSLNNPYIEEGFVAGRVGYARETDTMGFFVDLERRTGDDTGTTQNIRLRADGELSEDWSVGGEIFYGETTLAGNTTRDIDARFAAAQRRYGREPITLFQLEANQTDDAITTRTLYASVAHNRLLGEVGELGLRAAVRQTSAELSSGTEDSTTSFLGAEYRHDLSERLDFGVHGSMMQEHATNTTSHSLGLSFGLTPFENGWISLGYNVTGFDGDRFAEDGETQEGPFLQFRLKADQTSLSSLFRP